MVAVILGGGAVAVGLWSLAAPRLRAGTRSWASRVMYALPFGLMALLSAVALWMFILPQLR